MTGLHPDRHGIVANSFWDPLFGQRFSMYDRETVQDGRWWSGTPVWVTAERKRLATAPFFWPGSEAEIGGVRPSHWLPYDGSVPNAARVHMILELLDLPPTQRPVFLTLYFSDTDEIGHRRGPDSDEVDAAIAAVDTALGLLLDGLAARGAEDEVNVIVVSDHGMTSTSSDHVIYVEDYIDLADVDVSDWNPVLALWPKPGRSDAVYYGLRERHPRLHVYRKADLPERWHYTSHRRIPPLLAVADPGWSITTREHFAENPGRYDGGNHGFDPEDGEMAGIFIARGPGFRSGSRAEALPAVHVYSLLMHLLDLPPEPSDGRLEAVSHLLAP